MRKTTTTARNGGKECQNLKAYESKKICRQMTQLCQQLENKTFSDFTSQDRF